MKTRLKTVAGVLALTFQPFNLSTFQPFNLSTLHAAVVPQKSQTDYYFSLPNATNSVTRTNLLGQVIGQPPAYRSLRREDVAWLREAACERAALANGSWWTANELGRRQARPVFGHFPLSQTNRFASYTVAREWRNGQLETNIVVGMVWVTNAFDVAYPMSVQTAEGRDLAKPDNSPGIDVFGGLSFGSGEERYLLSSNGLLQGSQHVSNVWPPSRTNIVTTVITNWGGYSWDEGGNWVSHRSNCVDVVTMPMTNGTVSVRTNSWTVSLPWEVSSASTNVTPFSTVDLLFDGREARWDDATPPAAMRTFPVYSYITNSYGFLSRKRWLVDATSNTNSFQCLKRYWWYDYGDDTWKLGDSIQTNQTSFVGLFVANDWGYENGNGRMVFPTRFEWDVVHTGDVCRIKSAMLYALVYVSATWRDGEAWTNCWGRYVAKVGTATKVGSPQGGKVCFEADVDGVTIAKDGARAVGAPVRGSWTAWEDDEAQYSVSFFLVYEMQPWASLPSW